MGKRYGAIINNDVDYVDVRIYDNEFSGTALEFKIAEDSPSLSYDGTVGSSFFDSRIIGSSVSVDIIVAYDDTDFIDFFEDIVTSYEGRFVMEVVTEEIGYWRGIIMPDQASIIDEQYTIYNITATDGLASLKTRKYEYDNALGIKTPQSFIKHIIEILKLIPFVDEYYEETDVLLSVYTNYRNIIGHAGGLDPLLYSGCFNFFYNIKNNIAVYDSAWDVLTEICELFNARIYFKGSDTDGGYKFESIDGRYEDSGKEWVYYKNTTLRNYKQLNDAPIPLSAATTDHHNIVGGTFSFFPPLKSITKNFVSERANFNLLRNTEIRGSMTSGGAITDPASADLYYVHSEFYTDLRLAAKLDFNIVEEIATLWTGNDERLKVWLLFNIVIQIDDGTTVKQLNMTAGEVPGDIYSIVSDGKTTTVVNPDDLAWQNIGAGDGINYYMRFPPRAEVENTGAYGSFNDVLEFVTPVLPTYGTVSIAITIPSANFLEPDSDTSDFYKSTFITYSTGRELTWEISGNTRSERNSSIILSSSADGDLNKGAYGDQDSEALPLTVDTEESNTFAIEKNVRLADRIVGRDQYEWASQQQLLITDSATPTITDWEVSDGSWNYDGDGAGTEIEKLVTERMFRMQAKPVRLYSGTVIYNENSGIRPLFNRLVTYRGRTYMPLQLTWNMHRDFFSGTWVEVVYDAAVSVTVNAKEQDDSERSRNTRRSSTDTNTAYKVGAEASGNRFAVKPRFKSFTMAGVDTLDVTADDFIFLTTHTADEINANVDIFINNISYRYVASPTAMPQNTWTLDPDENTVQFWRVINGDGYIKEWDHYKL